MRNLVMGRGGLTRPQGRGLQWAMVVRAAGAAGGGRRRRVRGTSGARGQRMAGGEARHRGRVWGRRRGGGGGVEEWLEARTLSSLHRSSRCGACIASLSLTRLSRGLPRFADILPRVI